METKFIETKKEYEQLMAMKKSFETFCQKNNFTQLVDLSKKQFKAEKKVIICDGSFKAPALLKCRYDLAIPMKIGIDIKTTQATTAKQFEAACKYFDYDRSRAFYCTTSDIPRDYIIGVSVKAPYNVFIIDSFKSGFINSGHLKMNKLLKQYAYFFL